MNMDNENVLRPLKMVDFIGQENVKSNLLIAVHAARCRGEALDHVLLYGPPGTGKTSIAQILAAEMGSAIKIASAPLLDDPRDLTGILTRLREKDFLFLDEIHRLAPPLCEILFPALEDYRLDLTIGGNVHALKLKHFTFVGATTRPGMIAPPLRARFGIVHRLDFYSTDELARIVKRSASLLGCSIDDVGAEEIARRSRGTPRVANRLLRRCRDFAEMRGKGTVNAALASDALSALGIDGLGLESLDRDILRSLVQTFGGRPVGLETLAASVNEDGATLEETSEPFLMKLGLIDRTARGRMATEAAHKLVGGEPRVGGMVN